MASFERSWKKIYARRGPDGTVSQTLRRWNVNQLSNRARNIKTTYLKSGYEIPWFLEKSKLFFFFLLFSVETYAHIYLFTFSSRTCCWMGQAIICGASGGVIILRFVSMLFFRVSRCCSQFVSFPLFNDCLMFEI